MLDIRQCLSNAVALGFVPGDVFPSVDRRFTNVDQRVQRSEMQKCRNAEMQQLCPQRISLRALGIVKNAFNQYDAKHDADVTVTVTSNRSSSTVEVITSTQA